MCSLHTPYTILCLGPYCLCLEGKQSWFGLGSSTPGHLTLSLVSWTREPPSPTIPSHCSRGFVLSVHGLPLWANDGDCNGGDPGQGLARSIDAKRSSSSPPPTPLFSSSLPLSPGLDVDAIPAPQPTHGNLLSGQRSCAPRLRGDGDRPFRLSSHGAAGGDGETYPIKAKFLAPTRQRHRGAPVSASGPGCDSFPCFRRYEPAMAVEPRMSKIVGRRAVRLQSSS
jgi:hypothetical protein